LLSNAHLRLLDNNNSPQTIAANKLVDRFWGGFLKNNSGDRSFVLSARALDSLNSDSIYKWRIGAE
jgi:hypothetical protein